MTFPKNPSSPPFPKIHTKKNPALCPHTNVWIEASAGSGKTKALIDRILILLLEGTFPSQLLCVTFTNAASHEMARRVQEKISRWSYCCDQELLEDLSLLEIENSEPFVTQARQLMGLMLNDPLGIRIQTLHGLCQSLLKKFPLEAGVSPEFLIMDHHQIQKLQSQSRQILLQEIFRTPEHHLCQKIHYLWDKMSLKTFWEHLDVLFKERISLGGILEQPTNYRSFLEDLYKDSHNDVDLGFLRALMDGLKDSQDLIQNHGKEKDWDFFESLEKNLCSIQETFEHMSVQSPLGGESNKEDTDFFQIFMDQKNPYPLKPLDSFFLTQSGTPKKRFILTKLFQEISKNNPQLLEHLLHLQNLIVQERQKQHTQEALVGSLCFFEVFKKFFEVYQNLKEKNCLLDYDDLILKTHGLLKEKNPFPEYVPWILYKLDNQIKHILVDEAQDTSPVQWGILKTLIEGLISSSQEKTLFIVGDPKQSIYGFQGSDPKSFKTAQQDFFHSAQQAKARWSDVRLDTSFRSTPLILKVVDDTFQSFVKHTHSPIENTNDGIDFFQNTHHKSWKNLEDFGGCVEIWPPAFYKDLPNNVPEESCLPHISFGPSLFHTSQESPSGQKILAEELSARIYSWIYEEKIFIETEKRIIEPKDIMVLVTKRDEFLDHFVQACKNKRLPISGLDRFLLTDHWAVQDLIALGKWVLYPQDDLHLAIILKGPWLGWSEENVLDLTRLRRHFLKKDKSLCLWDILKEFRSQDSLEHLPHPQEEKDCPKRSLWGQEKDKRSILDIPNIKNHIGLLEGFLDCYKANPRPLEFYSWCLNHFQGHQVFYHWFGPNTRETLEEFLDVCLRFETQEEPHLSFFIHWLEDKEIYCEKDTTQGDRNEIRLMTVHGSKGLESPVVILADSCRSWTPKEHFIFHPLSSDFQEKNLKPTTNKGFLWFSQKISHPFFQKQYNIRQQEEHMEHFRLLYVGMTRAKERLYITGWLKSNQTSIPENCWMDCIIKGILESKALKDPTEKSLGSFSALQKEQTHTLVWEKKEFCPLTCPLTNPKKNKNLDEGIVSNIQSAGEKPQNFWFSSDFYQGKYVFPKELNPNKKTHAPCNPLSFNSPQPSKNSSPEELPSWILQPFIGHGQNRCVRPSMTLTNLSVAQEKALHIGKTVHHLLQYLPSCLPENQRGNSPDKKDTLIFQDIPLATGQESCFNLEEQLFEKAGFILNRYIDACHLSSIFSQKTKDFWARKVVSVLMNPSLRPYFKEQSEDESWTSLAEVPLAGWQMPENFFKAGKGESENLYVSGVIDRLIVGSEEIIILDFKTQKRHNSSFLDHYCQQLGMYEALLRKIYPNRSIKKAIVWVQDAFLCWLD
jgi:ATP-dependent helicase/nuclease subunit A